MENKCENCGKCCLETEMIISSEDIELIKKNSTDNIEESDFVFKNNNGHFQLKNTEGHCKFLDPLNKKCIIYEYRPQGCRFYPLIYNLKKKKCILDEDCPRTNLFYNNKLDLKGDCQNLKLFLKKQLNMEII